MTQSEYFFNSVSKSWVFRGDLLSAHYSLDSGLDELLKALFALNNELLPGKKWRIYESQSLKWTPRKYIKKLRETLLVKDITLDELNRRRKILRSLWKGMLPRAEKEVSLKFDEFSKMV